MPISFTIVSVVPFQRFIYLFITFFLIYSFINHICHKHVSNLLLNVDPKPETYRNITIQIKLNE